MKIFELGIETMARTGFTHRFEITFADLVALGAVLTGKLSLAAYAAGAPGVAAAAWRLKTPFDGGATATMAMIVGWDGATTDDDDGVISAVELHADATELLFGDGNGAGFATLRTGYFPLDAGTYKVTFTTTTGNMDALTQGEVHVYLKLVDLTKL